MDASLLVSLLVSLLLLGALILGVRSLLPVLTDHLKGSFGSATGWTALESAYATATAPKGHLLKRQSLVAGSVVYRYLVTAGISEAGLYLAVGGPLPRQPILIPWGEFKTAEPVRLFWRNAALVSVGAPQVGTLTLPMTLYERIRAHLPPPLDAFGISGPAV